jgi:hypothetical protein
MVYRVRKQASPPTAQQYTVPASVGGINALSSLMEMPPNDCVWCTNLMPSEYGMRLRKGYTEWANGLAAEVRTIIPFEGQSADVSSDRLWAVTENGIYNVTLSGDTSPNLDQAFSVQGEEAGYGVYTEFTNDANNRYLMYADAQNGLWLYTEDTELWTVPSLVGPDVTNIAFVMTWKNRLWFVEQDSGDAWYLPPNAIQGTAQKFTFGSKFTHGGELMGLWNWTVDGGDGVDDFLVAVSRGGDVLIYHGTDPVLPDFGLRGSFFISEVPESRRLAVEYGGELYLLSTYGITSVRDLLQGHEPTHTGTPGPSSKISRALRDSVQVGKDKFNWALHIHPADGFLQVISPYDEQLEALQYTQNLLTSSWGRWGNVPINCAETWSGEYFFGTKDGQIFWYDGVVDGTLLDGTVGQPIEFEVLTSFQAPGSHVTYKRVSTIRPIGILAGTASINVKAVYDYKVDALSTMAQPPPLSITGGSLWGASEGDPNGATWDQDVWDYSLAGASIPIGALGMGRAVAVGMKGSAATRLTLMGWDMLYTSGGPL